MTATVKYMNQLPLSDVVKVRIITENGIYPFETADTVNTEEVIEEGESQTLIIKGVLYANREATQTLKGYDLTFKDNVFCPELAKILNGGTIVYDSDGKTFKQYKPPAIGTKPVREKFIIEIFSAEVDVDGDTGRYVKFTFPDCKGNGAPIDIEDGTYYSSEYKIQSRPAKGTEPYVVDVIDALPDDTVSA